MITAVAPRAEEGRAKHGQSIQAAIRAPGAVIGNVLAGVGIALSPGVPALADTVHVPQLHAAVAGIAFAAITTACALAYRTVGAENRAYQWLNRLENAWTAAGSLGLVFSSGLPTSVFWLPFLMLVAQTSSSGVNVRLNLSLFCGGPLVLSLCQMTVHHNVTAGVVSLGMGAISVFVYYTVYQSVQRMRQALEEKDRLQAQLSSMMVDSERSRIARDLHDGVGAELAGLMWRAQLLAMEAPDDRVREELDTFLQRVRLGSDELRNVVWLLRQEQQAMGELAAHLRDRCGELCGGGPELEFSFTGPQERILPAPLRLHLVRATLEAVRNAVRHAQAAHIRVELVGADQVLLTVDDDGRGLPEGVVNRTQGGLANLRRRAAECGGTLQVHPLETGTRLVLALPWELPNAPGELASRAP